jgi:hypothetical protein
VVDWGGLTPSAEPGKFHEKLGSEGVDGPGLEVAGKETNHKHWVREGLAELLHIFRAKNAKSCVGLRFALPLNHSYFIRIFNYSSITYCKCVMSSLPSVLSPNKLLLFLSQWTGVVRRRT